MKEQSWIPRSPILPHFKLPAWPTRRLFIMLFSTIFGLGTLAYSLVLRDNRAFIYNIPASTGILILFILVQFIEFKEWGYKGTLFQRIAWFSVRTLLMLGINAMDTSGISIFLLTSQVFFTYFALGKTASILISLLYFISGIGLLGRTSSPWYLDLQSAFYLVSFGTTMIFMWILAHAIKLDEEGKQQTAALFKDLQESHSKLQAYSEQVAELAMTEERNRMARDIHDTLGHYLTIVNIQLEKSLAFRERDPQSSLQAILDAKQSASKALQDVRRSVSALRQNPIGFSLQHTLQELINGYSHPGFSISLNVEGSQGDFSHSGLMILYRAVQESLTNVHKHAAAQRVQIELQFNEYAAQMTIQDDGCGFPAPTGPNPDLTCIPGFGLRGIQERLELVHGQIEIFSQPGKGTELSILVPRSPIQEPRLNKSTHTGV